MMRAATLAFITAAVAGAGCAESTDVPRFSSEQDHVSLRQIDGWEARRQRGSLVFVGDADRGLDRTTIAVRAIDLSDGGAERRHAATLTQATVTALAGLPGATLREASPAEHDTMAAVAFELSFSPRKRPGQRYERRHVLLIGDQFAFHVIHTAPAGALGQTAALFDEVVRSVREEV